MSNVLAIHRFLQSLQRDRKSTRLNSSHTVISYAVFCLKKKKLNTGTASRRSFVYSSFGFWEMASAGKSSTDLPRYLTRVWWADSSNPAIFKSVPKESGF